MESIVVKTLCRALDEGKKLVRDEKFLAAAHLMSGLATELIKIHVAEHPAVRKCGAEDAEASNRRLVFSDAMSVSEGCECRSWWDLQLDAVEVEIDREGNPLDHHPDCPKKGM